MCGIVGCAGNLLDNRNTSDHQAFRDMLLFDVVRGQDSTGVVMVPTGTKYLPDIYKDIGPPSNMWEFKDSCSWMDYRGVVDVPCKVLIGHNRAATIGKINVENAHPFEFDHIYGVHNGTLWDDSVLEGKNFDTDSQKIFYTISKKGIKHTWKNIKGAAALVWWDEDTKLLNLARNKERPLYFAHSQHGALYWASEPWMITIAWMRNGIKPLMKDGKETKPIKLSENYVYQFSVTNSGYNLEGKEKLDFYVANKHTYNVGYSNIHKNEPKPVSRKDSDKINLGWARNFLKSSKEYRGLTAKINYTCCVYDAVSGVYKNYIVASFVDPNNNKTRRLEIYPRTYGEWKTFDSMCKNEDVWVDIKCRPRVKEYNKNKTFAMSTQYLKVNKKEPKPTVMGPKPSKDLDVIEGGKKNYHDGVLKGYGGELVSLSDFYDQLANAGQTCASCDTVLTHEDASTMEWVNRQTVLCEDCACDPFIFNELCKAI